MARVLVACEVTGTVREAFRAQGHDAWSCDLLPAADKSEFHIHGNVLDHLDEGWDLMIAHPPCTYLAVSGAGWWRKDCAGRKAVDFPKMQADAMAFVVALMNAPVPFICIENPRSIISRLRKRDQEIQPFQFGHPESKATWLWLKNLPLLVPTKVLRKPRRGYWDNQTPSGQNKIGPCEDRWLKRAATYPGIAAAMSEQWGPLVDAQMDDVPDGLML